MVLKNDEKMDLIADDYQIVEFFGVAMFLPVRFKATTLFFFRNPFKFLGGYF